MSLKRIQVIFKTHLDLGFTDYATEILRQYMEEYIPKACDLAEKLNQNGKKRFIWTTGSYMIYEYLRTKRGEERKRLENAIKKGDICWHALPFTTSTELMSRRLFEYGLSLSQELDREFSKETIAAKFTDVPGHTRSIISPMSQHGIKYLHIGVNGGSAVPEVPPLFVWRNAVGHDLIVEYCGDYGLESHHPDLDVAQIFHHSGDNSGPPNEEQILEFWSNMEKTYPNAVAEASTMDAYAKELLTVKDRLPVITSEIADTWIHGIASDPYKTACFKGLLRKADEWSENGNLPQETLNSFLHELLPVAEHTSGLDFKKFFSDYAHYDKYAFQAARKLDVISDNNTPPSCERYLEFSKEDYEERGRTITWDNRRYSAFSRSHKEQREYLTNAVAILPKALNTESILDDLKPQKARLTSGIQLKRHSVSVGKFCFTFSGNGAAYISGGSLPLPIQAGLLQYQLFGLSHLTRYQTEYSRVTEENEAWVIPDFFKPGLSLCDSRREDIFISPKLLEIYMDSDNIIARLAFPTQYCENEGCPREAFVQYSVDERRINIECSLFGKDASRKPEALWFSFFEGAPIHSPRHLKLGEWVNPLDVVYNGNRAIHCVEQVEFKMEDSRFVFAPLDAPLICLGERRLYDFNPAYAPLSGGIHSNIYNNLWGTNYPLWYDEDILARYWIQT